MRIAVAVLQGTLAGEDAQRCLAALAVAILRGVLELATREIEERHGRIPAPADVERLDRARNSLAVIAYGSLGAFEPDVGELRAGVCKPEDSDPDTEVSFENDVLPLFQRKPPEIGCGCHQPDSMRPIGIDISGLDLSSYSAVMRGGETVGWRLQG